MEVSGGQNLLNIWWPISRTPFEIQDCARHHSIYLIDFYFATHAQLNTALRWKVKWRSKFATYGGRYHEHRLRYRIEQHTIRFISLTSTWRPKRRVDTSLRCKARGGQSLEVSGGQNFQTYGGRYHEHRLRYRIAQDTIRFISLTSTLPHRRDWIPLCVGKCGAVKVCNIWWPISRTPFEISD